MHSTQKSPSPRRPSVEKLLGNQGDVRSLAKQIDERVLFTDNEQNISSDDENKSVTSVAQRKGSIEDVFDENAHLLKGFSRSNSYQSVEISPLAQPEP